MSSTDHQPHVLETYEPAHPSRLVAQQPLTSDIEVEAALGRARVAQRNWARNAAQRSVSLDALAAALDADTDTVVNLLVREVGKPLTEARAEVGRAVAILRYYSQIAFDPIGEEFPSPNGRGRLQTQRMPLGTVAIITPWNFPIAIPLWKLAPALASGNAVIWKPSSSALAVSKRLMGLATRVLPADVLVSVVLSPSQADRLVDEPAIDGLSFTGSASVGSSLASRAAKRGIPVQAEMGGQNASIVLADAHLEHAAETIASAAMGYAGQKCTATRRVIVEKSVADTFVPLLAERVRSLAVGEPLDPQTLVGPLISEAARSAVEVAIQGALGRGAEHLAGGARLDREGWFIEPALLQVRHRDDEFVQEETFGPAAAVLTFDGVAEAIEIANSTRYGLSAAVFGSNLERATSVAHGLVAGMIRVNASTTGVEFYTPFGGERASSYGPREQGRAARDFYTHTRTISINPVPDPSS
jgi:acyl-CoA reductase-like NAD-dependent aldehyde dehydrogenase